MKVFQGDKRSTVAFVGYTDPSTPGWRLRHAKVGDRIQLNENKPPVEVKAQIESFDFSAHATREDICDYIVETAPAKVLLVHGDEPAMNWIGAQVAERLPAAQVFKPESGEEIELW